MIGEGDEQGETPRSDRMTRGALRAAALRAAPFALATFAACARTSAPQAAPIGESRAPSDAAIDAACRTLCALRPDYAGSSRPIPSFSLKNVGGAVVTSDDLRGRVVLLNVWSSIAAAVVASEMPELAKLAAALRERSDVALVTIAAEDFPDHATDLLKRTLGDSAKYTVLVDEGAKVAAKLGTVKYPETWLVDRSGVLRARFDGRRAWSSAKVLALLDATVKGSFCPAEIDQGYISGAGDAACEAASRAAPSN